MALPGDLLHVDWTTLARFEQPGHAVPGDRSSPAAKKRRKVGYDVVHAIVDDHSRLAYAEVLADAKPKSVTCFAEHGIQPRRLMRPHSSLGGRPPVSRVRNVCRQDNEAPVLRRRSSLADCASAAPSPCRGARGPRHDKTRRT